MTSPHETLRDLLTRAIDILKRTPTIASMAKCDEWHQQLYKKIAWSAMRALVGELGN